MIRTLFSLLTILVAFSALAGSPSGLVQLVPPAGFEGPTTAEAPGGGHIDAYVRPIAGTTRSTLLQVSTYDLGSKLEGVPTSELGDGAEHYLMQFIGGVARARANFQSGKPTRTTLGGLPSARVEWTGIARGRPMSGVMYCTIVGTNVVTLHMQGFEDSPREDRDAALRAIESVKFVAGK